MNVRELATRALYLALALFCIATGLWLLVDPAGSNAALQLQAIPADAADQTLQSALLRKIGATYLCISLAFLWCLIRADVRRTVHAVLVLFFGLLAAIDIADLVAAGAAPAQWLVMAPLTLLPPLLLVLMPLLAMVRLPTLALPAGGETGVVKWFDTRKGFGFITRANGEELFVHYRSIRGADKGTAPRALRDGQTVRFTVGEGKKGPQAEDVVPLA